MSRVNGVVRYGPTPKIKDMAYLEEWSMPEPNTGCWIWMGATSGKNSRYGTTQFNGRLGLAHRAAYAIATGVDPGALNVCHKCDFPICVNPDHLFLGTQKDNLQDMVRKGRTRPNPCRGESNGRAKITWEQVQEIRSRRATGETLASLAEDFGMSVSPIHRMTTGQNWKLPR